MSDGRRPSRPGRYPKPTSGRTKLKILNQPLDTKLKILNRLPDTQNAESYTDPGTQNSNSQTALWTHKTQNPKPTSAASSPSCRPVRRRRRLADVFAGLLDDFPPTSSRAASGDCSGPPPGLPPRPPSKMDHFSIVRCIRIGHFSARSGPVPFWDLGRPGSPRAKHIVKPQRRYRLRRNIL